MKRDITALAEREYDLVVVGGGIFGICAAWDAALRGLQVALIERGDFAHATSANSFRIVHGGMRYLQHVDFQRVRESSRERNILLRIAPHLVQWLPVVIPTYGHGLKGQELLRAGLLLYNLITQDQDGWSQDGREPIPRGGFISRQECLALFPHLENEGLTGAAIFYDGQMYHPARLALAFLRSAVEAGADVANYMEVIRFIRQGDRVVGVEARDRLSDTRLEVRGKVILNATGPWAEPLLEQGIGLRLRRSLSFSRDVCLLVARRPVHAYALAVPGRTKDPDAILSRGRRHLFIVPWRGYTLVGVWHKIHTGSPDSFTVTEEEVQRYLDELNEAYPALALRAEDVLAWNAGLVLFGENEPGAADLSYGKRSQIVDHARDHGIEGLITLVGVRFTTARGVAARVVDLVFHKLGQEPPRSMTEVTPVHGGQIQHLDAFVAQAVQRRPSGVSVAAMRALVYNHGSAYGEVLSLIGENSAWAETVGSSDVLKAEIVYAVREEMAQRLSDVVFRRTDLAIGGHPGDAVLEACAEVMAVEMGWSDGRMLSELAEVQAAFPNLPSRGSGQYERIGLPEPSGERITAAPSWLLRAEELA